MKFIVIFALLLVSLLASSGAIKPKKSLTVLTRNAPTTYYYGADDKPRGFEYDMVKAFASDRGYDVNFTVKPSIKEVLEALSYGEADFAAAGLTNTPKRQRFFLMGPDYYDVQEQVICGYKKNPKSTQDLLQYKIEIIRNSSYADTMKKIRGGLPSLSWKEHEGFTTEHIFERINQKKVECTVADSHIVSINRRYYPRMNVAFAVSEKESLAWMLPKSNKSIALQKEIQHWFKTFKKSKKFTTLKDTYFAHVEIFDYVDIRTYHERIKSRLPKYLKIFQAAGKKYDIDWRLLAAQAYQESHWNPNAKSPTGVRGMMMLTLPTAKQMGIKNRLDPKQSIEGGAKYMARQIKYAPKNVKGKIDRVKFALAGYNIGRGHIYDAIKLGKNLGRNPYIWVNMKKILPLLSEREHFKELRYGYARGHEPVHYVIRINNYFDILQQYYDK
ncbi:MAG: membrane-bound lytic murein transglycosylase MltF [Campylobacterota bacterium]|nr:membrane-bound lytic murein transglycosylase MltF [Campylobacterota bacterium]